MRMLCSQAVNATTNTSGILNKPRECLINDCGRAVCLAMVFWSGKSD